MFSVGGKRDGAVAIHAELQRAGQVGTFDGCGYRAEAAAEGRGSVKAGTPDRGVSEGR